MKGRPLRFLAVALGVWTIARGAALWPVEEIVDAIGRHGPIAPAIAGTVPLAPSMAIVAVRGRTPLAFDGTIASALPPLAPASLSERTDDGVRKTQASPSPPQASALATAIPVTPPPVAPPSVSAGRSRFGGSLWGIARGGPSATLLGGELGASQAGMRITYALGKTRRLALAARLSTPLGTGGREAAIGLDWQPSAAPLHLIAEQRFAIDGGRGGPVLGVIGGFGPLPIGGRWKAEGYAQAGAIKRDIVEGFADGSLRLTQSIIERGAIRVEAGGGAWGGMQRGTQRLDVGPTVGISVPIGSRRLRLAADWRQRVAGDARPGSGPAISIGSDF